jgi:4-amino-4-deoxy-L-arabinose transferase-like glycosyltransferase
MREEQVRPKELALLALLTVAVRAAYVFAAAPRRLPYTDALGYHLEANQIAHGKWFLQPLGVVFLHKNLPSAAHPPLYPLVLALGSRFGASSVRAHELAGCVFGVGTVIGVTLLANRLSSKRAALISGAVVAIFPTFWLNDGGVMSEGLYALTITLVLVASYRFIEQPGMLRAVLVGATIALAALTRAEAILLVVVLLIPLVVRYGDTRKLGLIGIGLAGVLVVTAPWVVRNMAEFSKPVTLSTGDSTLAGANCPTTYGGSAIGLWLQSCYDQPPPGDESVAAAFWRKQGLRYASKHVSRLPLVAAARVARMAGVFRPMQTAEQSADDGRPRWAVYATVISFWLLAPLGIAGIVILMRRRAPVLPLLAQVALVLLSAIFVWGAIRFRVPAEVAFAVCSGVALDTALQQWG